MAVQTYLLAGLIGMEVVTADIIVNAILALGAVGAGNFGG